MLAYKRFLKYAKVYTTSDRNSQSHPSSQRQFDLAKMLVEELHEMGIGNAFVDNKCYVYAVISPTSGYENAPALGFIAHMDTADDACGENVLPQLHENYNGKSITLSDGVVMELSRFPFLKKLKGQTLITTNGKTLLGADDKAGVAEIFTMAERLLQNNLPHGKICIAITPDEEIGEGADLFDFDAFGADFAYTVDGDDVGEINYENFNAASALVTFHGLSVHPGSAKNMMINAQNVAIEFHNALPLYDRPEHTQMHEGFYHLCSMAGDVTTAKLGYIVRDHDKNKFEARKAELLHMAACINEKYGSGTVEIKITDSYYNMLEKIMPHMHLIKNARKAAKAAGVKPVEMPIRGGTDGASLSFKGLPCPNLGTGGFNFHGVFECITVEKMEQATAMLLNLVDIYKDFK